MTLSLPGLLIGALVALSGALAVRAFMPKRVPLDVVLGRTPAADLHPEGGRAGWTDRMGQKLVSTTTVADRLPAQDLAVLEITPAHLLGQCVLYALIGFIGAQWLVFLVTLGGMSLPWIVALALGVGFAAFLALERLKDYRSKARDRRMEYSYYTASLLERVALARNSDAGAPEALDRALKSGDGPAAVRIRDAVEHAALSGVSPWDALTRLGDELGVPALARIGASLSLAGEEQAAVYEQLRAQAVRTRESLFAERKKKAGEATENMRLPAIAIVFLMALFLVAPQLIRVMNF
ncbi:type II secretion system F family protein [Streptomyces sp. BH097]|uniref:type II secretion system F family protein n=1 Tax=unclassified Streptomyces TaxID=2593676 RepID=UPI003BB55D54